MKLLIHFLAHQKIKQFFSYISIYKNILAKNIIFSTLLLTKNVPIAAIRVTFGISFKSRLVAKLPHK